MTRLIDADAFIEKLVHVPMVQEAIKKAMDTMPAVDTVPVVHGRWIDIDEQSYTWKVRCSECGHERSMMSTQGEYPNYCENCGARMDDNDRHI